MIKTKNVFAINAAPCKSLADCLAAYSKVQLQILVDRMNLDHLIKQTAKKTELVAFLSEQILSRLDYLFCYLDYPVFIVAAAFSKDDENDTARVLEDFKESFGDGAEDQIELSILLAIENGIFFLFSEDEENPILLIPNEVKSKIAEIVAATKKSELSPGDLNQFMCYAETLSALYGLCTKDVFLQIYNRDNPKSQLSESELNLLLGQAALVSGEFIYKDGMIQNHAVDKKFAEYILDDRKKFKPYIPSEEEIFEHEGLSDYDEENPTYRKFVDFLNKKLKDEEYAEEAALDIIPVIKVCYPVQNVIDYMQNEYGLFESPKSLEKFLPIYQDLVGTSHLWSNWGHVPESLRKEDGSLKKSAYSEEFLDELKKEKENRPHIELPENCVVPSDKEIEKCRKEFDDYWGNNKSKPVWQKDGEKVMSRIMKEIKANINLLSQLLESSLNMLFDQWLASVYHANANRSSKFGSRTWNFYAFDISEKLRENLFTCLLADGTPIVVASPSVNRLFNDDYISCLTVLVDMGGWFIAYGPQLGWKGITARDIEAIAKSVASQTYELKGLSGVMHFNPVPLWRAQKISAIPPVFHKGHVVTQCFCETRFAENKAPDFPSDWKHETSGKSERWIFNKEDYLGSAAVYHDTKTLAVLLYSANEELFDKSYTDFSRFFDLRHCETKKISMSAAALIKNDKKEKLLQKFEKAFER